MSIEQIKMQAFKQAIDSRLKINPEIKVSDKMLANLTKFFGIQLTIAEYIELNAYIETFK